MTTRVTSNQLIERQHIMTATMIDNDKFASFGIVAEDPGPVIPKNQGRRRSKYSDIRDLLEQDKGTFYNITKVTGHELTNEANARRIAHAANNSAGGWNGGHFEGEARRTVDEDGTELGWKVFVRYLTDEMIADMESAKTSEKVDS